MMELWITLPNNFGELLEEYKQTLRGNVPSPAPSTIPEIDYNKITGVGQIGDKKFKLKDGTAEYRIFAALYENINKKLGRISVLEVGHFYEEGEDSDPARKTLETAFINDAVKAIREKTGLSVNQLVQNNGNLTLIGKNTTNEPQV